MTTDFSALFRALASTDFILTGGLASPMPLAPMTERISDGPRRAPGVRNNMFDYFRIAAVQLTTTVSGAALDCWGVALTRNRSPSFVTAYWSGWR